MNNLLSYKKKKESSCKKDGHFKRTKTQVQFLKLVLNSISFKSEDFNIKRILLTNEKEKRENTLPVNNQRMPRNKNHSSTKSLNFTPTLKTRKNNFDMPNLKNLTYLVNKINDSKFKLLINEKNIKEINNIIISARGLFSRSYSFISAKKKREKELDEPKKIKFDNLIYRPKNITQKNLLSLSNFKNESLIKNESSKRNKNECFENIDNFVYYTTLMRYFLQNPDDEDYFNLLYREHFLQSFNSFKFCFNIKKKDLNAEKKIELGPNPKSILLKKNYKQF